MTDTIRDYLTYCVYFLSIVINTAISILSNQQLMAAVAGVGILATTVAAVLRLIRDYRDFKKRR